MAKKVKELTNEESSKEWSELSSAGATITAADPWERGFGSQRRFGPNHEHVVGICARCSHYEYAENDMHQIVHAQCDMYSRNLGRNRIADCSSFHEKGQLTLRDMYAIATLIEQPKKKIGMV